MIMMVVIMVMVVMIMIMMMVVIVVMVLMLVVMMVMVVVHRGYLLGDFSNIIVSPGPDVKAFIFSGKPPGAVAQVEEKWYNTRKKGGRTMSDQHSHVHENQKAVVNRLARAIGHLNKVKRMVEEGYDCGEVLIQLAAVRSAIDNTGKVILNDHIRHCMVDAVQLGDESAIDGLCEAIEKFMK